MDARLSKTELLSGVKVLQAAELDAQVSPKRDHWHPTETKQESVKSGSLDGIAIARAELARRRRKLGTLTPEQEVAIEDLLFSTAIRVSELVGRALDAILSKRTAHERCGFAKGDA